MTTETISASAHAICDEHYGGWRAKDNGCGRCPIHRECLAPHEWSQPGIDAWRDRINAAASCIENAKISTRSDDAGC